MTRLPTPGGDDGSWGQILNDFLTQSHNGDGTLKSEVVTGASIQSGTIAESKLDAALQVKVNTVGGVTDHGALTGLADDDHTQYMNQARGDARYYTQAQVNSTFDTSDGVAEAVAGVYPLRNTVTTSAARRVRWVGPAAPTIGSGYASEGDIWEKTP